MCTVRRSSVALPYTDSGPGGTTFCRQYSLNSAETPKPAAARRTLSSNR